MVEEYAELPVDGLLTEDERVDLTCLMDMANRYPVTSDTADMQHQLKHIYLEGRLSGLCREGALELVTDALSAMRPGTASTDHHSSEG